MPKIGILAYGSLVDEPGDEIQAALDHVVTDAVTPFRLSLRAQASRAAARQPLCR
ncbi:MAG: hypothetical protein AB7O44_26555 [Hyphomicrobiaceae bacterium]